MSDYISGIQQIGIGVKNMPECLHYYAKLFSMDALIFKDIAEASLMTKYTGGTIHKRQASLSMNMQGGGGFELWQFLSRTPQEALPAPVYGDLGIYAAILKSTDVTRAYNFFCDEKDITLSPLQTGINGEPVFWLKDRYNNIFKIIKGNYFDHKNKPTGGVAGAVIGVSDMNASLHFYKTLLNSTGVAYDAIVTENIFESLSQRYRKVLLKKTESCQGAFGKLLGATEIELVQCLDRKPLTIFENRFWGDCGFIHLCFDVFNMDGLKKSLDKSGYALTVDSVNSFGMQDAAGRFCYIEDTDGTLIELVETHKVPVLKKLGLYYNLKKKGLEKPLPDWMIKLLALSKIK